MKAVQAKDSSKMQKGKAIGVLRRIKRDGEKDSGSRRPVKTMWHAEF